MVSRKGEYSCILSLVIFENTYYRPIHILFYFYDGCIDLLPVSSWIQYCNQVPIKSNMVV